jgi:hypothetical protein
MRVSFGGGLKKRAHAKKAWPAKRRLNSRRRAWRVMLEDRLRLKNGFSNRGDPGDGKRRLEGQLSDGKGSRSVARLANLAVLLVKGLLVPVHERVKAQRAHHNDEQDCE